MTTTTPIKTIIEMENIPNRKLLFYMLTGPARSGKSTFRQGLVDTYKKLGIEFVILSTDDILMEKASEKGLTYNEAFEYFDYYGEIEKEMFDRFQKALDEKRNIIIDQTNITVKTRLKKLSFLKDKDSNYVKIATYINQPLDVLKSRNVEKGKIIPISVLENMVKNYEQPSLLEGFDVIIPLTLDVNEFTKGIQVRR